jgi:hypothetical protein
LERTIRSKIKLTHYPLPHSFSNARPRGFAFGFPIHLPEIWPERPSAFDHHSETRRPLLGGGRAIFSGLSAHYS